MFALHFISTPGQQSILAPFWCSAEAAGKARRKQCEGLTQMQPHRETDQPPCPILLTHYYIEAKTYRNKACTQIGKQRNRGSTFLHWWQGHEEQCKDRYLHPSITVMGKMSTKGQTCFISTHMFCSVKANKKKEKHNNKDKVMNA